MAGWTVRWTSFVNWDWDFLGRLFLACTFVILAGVLAAMTVALFILDRVLHVFLGG